MPVFTISTVVVQGNPNSFAAAVNDGDTLNLLASGALIAVNNATTHGLTLGSGFGAIANISGSIVSTLGLGISAQARAEITINTNGSVYGSDAAILTGGNVKITNSGSITALAEGIECFAGGGDTIANLGIIHAGNVGVYIRTPNNVIGNSGVIEGNLYGIFTINAGIEPNHTTVYNLGGTIHGGNAGIQLFGTNNSVLNTGAIIGDSQGGIIGGNGVDMIVNNGVIACLAPAITFPKAVMLNTGDDVYDGRGGQAIGIIDGGLGNDTILGGAMADAIDGGADHDQLSGFGGDDVILGGAGVDTVSGGAGADRLFGQADGDLIIGGAGGDIIQGGLGGDLYMFNAGDNGDLIQNFNEGGVRDGFDLRGYFDATGFTGTNPRAAGIMQVLQSGTDTDVYLHGAFAFRIQGVTAAAIDDTYFLFQ
jgi:Ca2+-binding RTX toxin-like protein